MRGIASRVALTMYRSNAMARNVNAFAKSPKLGLAGCHWNGTDASIRNAGRRTFKLAIGG
jgi:hypothetical protein